ncbi:MAG: tRNA epoxyqueuosine(34) reductase QueG [Balneolaceae bacterium]|nr:tRNA epoxyqueuosine(34) reductase QueG [Balneolaceae bacterium]
MDIHALTNKVRLKSFELGFDQCGFAKAGPLDPEAFRLEQWLNQNLHGTMGWMENYFDKRVDPTILVPGAKSVVSVLASYRFKENEEHDRETDQPKIAKYARGRDYHKTFKNRLKKLFFYTKELTGDINGRFFVDSAPVMDKAWAKRAGLGWMGKNSNLLNKTYGSFFLIGEMIVDIPFVYDAPQTDHCGSCTQCIDACPTDAIHEPYRIDSNRCISYLTIELKEQMPDEFEDQLGDWAFGCDICQDVCPWNRKAKYGHINDLKPREQVLHPPKRWTDLKEEEFEDIFEGSAVRRAGYKRFTENASRVENHKKEFAKQI